MKISPDSLIWVFGLVVDFFFCPLLEKVQGYREVTGLSFPFPAFQVRSLLAQSYVRANMILRLEEAGLRV